MGKILQHLAETNVSPDTIFDKRIVFECCETFHLHWRNLRLEFTHENYLKFVATVTSAFKNWKEKGMPAHHSHFEMGRNLLSYPMCTSDEFKIERCDNLYKKHRGSSDAEFYEDDFIHIHYRDLRMEMPVSEFAEMADKFEEAKNNLVYKPQKSSLSKLFDLLDSNNIIYVVLRNWDNLPDDVNLGPHSDLDLLIHPLHLDKIKQLWRLEATQADPCRVQYKCPLSDENGENYILCDLRTTTDNYYPEDFANRILNSRVKHKNFYVLPPDIHFYSLLYHVVYHKGVMTSDYQMKLVSLSNIAGIYFDISSAVNLSYLSGLLESQGICYVKPKDLSVRSSLPFLSEIRDVIYSKHLTDYKGVKICSRIYKKSDRDKPAIIKQTTFDLAKGEFDLLSRLHSRYFPRVYKTEHKDYYSMFEMEFVEGYLLEDIKAHADEWDKKKADKFIRGCLSILEELKAKNIIHRDILPGNIIVRNFEPVLIDFGWSISGNEEFITPEGLGAWGRPADGSFSDSYSMGVSLLGFAAVFPEYYPVLKKLTDSAGSGSVINYKSLKKRLPTVPADDIQNDNLEKINDLIQTVVDVNPSYSPLIYNCTGINKLPRQKELTSPALEAEVPDEKDRKVSVVKKNENNSAPKDILASVILTVSEQSELSGEWFNTLKENTPEDSYELIIAGNGSLSGHKLEIPEIIKECAKVIETDSSNLGDACSQCISNARGRYIVLLENNVKVPSGWLSNIISRMEQTQNTGLVVTAIAEEGSGFGPGITETGEYFVNFPVRGPGRTGSIQDAAGLCVLFKKDMLNIIGTMDAKYSSKSFVISDLLLKAMAADYNIVTAEDVFIRQGNKGVQDSKFYDFCKRLRNDFEYFIEKWKNFLEFDGKVYNVCLTEKLKQNKLVQWGEEQMAAGNSRSAAKIFKRVFPFIRDDYRALNNLGVIQWQLGEKESAITSFYTAVKVNPGDKDSVSNFLQAAKEGGRTDLIRSTLPAIEGQLNSAV